MTTYMASYRYVTWMNITIIKSSNKFNFSNNITLENKYILTDQKNNNNKEKGNNDENIVSIMNGEFLFDFKLQLLL